MTESVDISDFGFDLPDEIDTLAVKGEWLLGRLEELDPSENLDAPGLGKAPVFSAAEALCEALRLHHGGMGSDEYRLLCRLGRILRPGRLGVALDEHAQEVYSWLTRAGR